MPARPLKQDANHPFSVMSAVVRFSELSSTSGLWSRWVCTLNSNHCFAPIFWNASAALLTTLNTLNIYNIPVHLAPEQVWRLKFTSKFNYEKSHSHVQAHLKKIPNLQTIACVHTSHTAYTHWHMSARFLLAVQHNCTGNICAHSVIANHTSDTYLRKFLDEGLITGNTYCLRYKVQNWFFCCWLRTWPTQLLKEENVSTLLFASSCLIWHRLSSFLSPFTH